MALYRQIDFNKGSLLDRMGAVVSANTGVFTQKGKGQALEVKNGFHTTYNQQLLPSGAFTIVAWVQVPLSIGSRINIISNLAFDNAISPKIAAGNYAALYMAPANVRLWNTPPVDSSMHCHVYTIPGNAQADINSAKLFIDNVAATVFSTDVTSAQSSRSIYTSVGSGNNTTMPGYISRIKVYDTVLSRAEIDDEYAEFLAAQPINKPKRGFTMPNKPTNLSQYVGSGEGQGLLASYNMVKNGNTLVDISGNGYNGTCTDIVSNKNGLLFSKNDSSKIPLTGNMNLYNGFTITARINRKTINTWETIFGSTTAYNQGVWFSISSGKLNYRFQGSATDYPGTATLSLDRDYTVTMTYNATTATVVFYVDGVLDRTYTSVTAPTGTASQAYQIGSTGVTYTFLGSMQDLRVYNRALSATEVAQYHNQFVQPTLVEDFSDAGADGVTKSDAPREWERVSGTWKISENIIQTSPIYTSNFSTNDSWFGALGLSVAGGVTIGGLSNCLECTITGGSSFHVAQRTVSTVLGNKYTVTGKIYFPASGNANGFQVATTDGLTVYSVFTPITKDSWYDFTVTYTAVGSSPNTIRIIPLVNGSSPFSNDGQKYYLRDINIVQVPQLDTMTNGTKYLENVSAGIIAIPSNTAYGSWEFDWYKAADANDTILSIISDKAKQYNQSFGYMVNPSISESILFYRDTNTGATSIMGSANSYFTINTWYRIKITRTVSGVFTVLIKGGAFTPTAGYDGYTLVSVSGGSGTNPKTDDTYTTSSYFVVDLDAGDRVANIVIKDGIKI